jgi:hypothetical protein
MIYITTVLRIFHRSSVVAQGTYIFKKTLNPTVQLHILFSHPKQVTAKILRVSQMPLTHSLNEKMTFLSKESLLLQCEMLLFYPGPQKRLIFHFQPAGVL